MLKDDLNAETDDKSWRLTISPRYLGPPEWISAARKAIWIDPK
jgi:hypothetical protein